MGQYSGMRVPGLPSLLRSLQPLYLFYHAHTSATRAGHCRSHIMSLCPECPASPSLHPGPWADVGNTCSTPRGGVLGRQRFGTRSLVLRSTNPTSVPGDDPGHTSVCFFFFLTLNSGCLLGLLSRRQQAGALCESVAVHWRWCEQAGTQGRATLLPSFASTPTVIASLPEPSHH